MNNLRAIKPGETMCLPASTPGFKSVAAAECGLLYDGKDTSEFFPLGHVIKELRKLGYKVVRS